MKRLLSIVLIGLAFIMPLQGFSSELDLAPNEKITVGDLDYSFYVVVSSDIEVDLGTNTNTDSCSTIYVLDRFAGNNSETNHFGLPSTPIVMDKYFTDYPDLNEWKTNRNELDFKHFIFIRSLGGVNLKISQLSL